MTEAETSDYEKKKTALTYAADNRKVEISFLWSRSLYFWGFITVVLISYGTAITSTHRELAMLAACFGFVASLCWTLSIRSSKYWQQVWEEKVENIEREVFVSPIFLRSTNPIIAEEKYFWGPKQYSPSKLAMAISDMTLVVWFVLAAITCLPDSLPYALGTEIFAPIATVIYCVFILYRCQSGDPISFAEMMKRLSKLRLFSN